MYMECTFNITDITRCELWDGKYCLKIEDLAERQDYFIIVSVKNEKTHKFGSETSLSTSTYERGTYAFTVSVLEMSAAVV